MVPMDPPGIDSFGTYAPHSSTSTTGWDRRTASCSSHARRGSIEGILNVLKLPVRSEGSEPEPLTDEQRKTLGEATARTKKRLREWMRYQDRLVTQGNGGNPTSGSSTLKSRLSLFKLLKTPKSTRPLRGVEMYQKMYPAKIKEAVMDRGYSTLTEDTAAAEDSETVSSSKIGTVMKVVEDATAAENTRCRAGEVADSEEKTPEYYQFAIDQIGAIFAKVQEMTLDQTGWFGFTILGGPMPRRDGQISTKTICFGQSENGLDFAASLPTFNENVKGPFQSWLKRVFLCAYLEDFPQVGVI
ncbi:hypothetical protein B0H14DRAFT_2631063 [Mycena olivaceomarginata]|nr:hypothetical protein B0H14DRAFT_2631063 [Mycena olivaceomarginata]